MSEYSIIVKTQIGKFLYNLRSNKNLTQKQVADKIGVTRKSVINIEKGVANYSINQLIEYMRILNVHLEISELTADNNNRTRLANEPPPSKN